jgi:hypothetical protein
MKTAKKSRIITSYVQHLIPKIKEQTKSKRKRHNSGTYLPEYFL